MSWNEFRAWLGILPWYFKWFIILILIRPVLDTLYFLKDISPFLSPLYITGVATPVIILIVLLIEKDARKGKTAVDIFFYLWSILVLYGALTMLIDDLSVASLGDSFKHITPVFIFFFTRRLISSVKDLHGVMTAFLYSCIIPLSMIMFETFVAPLGDVVQTRGSVRYEGLYADVLSYAIYVLGSFAVACYFFISAETKESFNARAWRLIVISSVTLVSLFSMHHTASWGVAAALLALLVYHSLASGNYSMPAFLVILILGGALVAGGTIVETLSASLESEIAVIEGEKETTQAFHGRMSRWTYYIIHWKSIAPVEMMIGANVNPGDTIGGLMGNMHNDYLRVLFTTGIIGLLSYLAFYAIALSRTLWAPAGRAYIVRAGALIMLLLSLTTVPTLYSPLLYLTFSIIAYACLGSGRESSAASPLHHSAPLARSARARRVLTPNLANASYETGRWSSTLKPAP